MSVTDHERRVLFDRLEAVLGSTEAAVLMELLPPVGWADVARRGDIAELRGEMAELRAELRGEMAELRTELTSEMAELRSEIADLRSGASGIVPRLVAANIASMVGVAGLVLAAGAVL